MYFTGAQLAVDIGAHMAIYLASQFLFAVGAQSPAALCAYPYGIGVQMIYAFHNSAPSPFAIWDAYRL
jgi:hypothetical protein